LSDLSLLFYCTEWPYLEVVHCASFFCTLFVKRRHAYANVALGTSSESTVLLLKDILALVGTTRNRYSPPWLGCAAITAADQGGVGCSTPRYLHSEL
jgi:hypothetical protein